MAGKSDYAENKVIDHMLGVATFAAVTPYVALMTAAPSDSGGGTECAYGSYARVATSGKFGAASGGSSANTSEIAFPEGSSGSETATHFAIYDASTSGNLLGWNALTTSRAVGSGITPRFAIGALVYTED